MKNTVLALANAIAVPLFAGYSPEAWNLAAREKFALDVRLTFARGLGGLHIIHHLLVGHLGLCGKCQAQEERGN